MLDTYFDSGNRFFFELIIIVLLLFWLGKKLFVSILNSTVLRDWASLKFFVGAVALFLIFIFDKPKWDFLFSAGYFLIVFFLLYKGCTTGCNKEDDIQSSSGYDDYDDYWEGRAEVGDDKEDISSPPMPKETMVIVPCPGCEQKLRIPQNKTIVATCPKCRIKFRYPNNSIHTLHPKD